jgi:hypothetical protein
MNAEQFHLILKDLAKVAGLADPALLVDQCRVRVGGMNVVLEHSPDENPDVLFVRAHLGRLEEKHRALITTVLLETNFVNGWGGIRVFSLVPQTDQVVLTVSTPLLAATTPHDLWQVLSDVASQGGTMWRQITAAADTAKEALFSSAA